MDTLHNLKIPHYKQNLPPPYTQTGPPSGLLALPYTTCEPEGGQL